MKIMEISSPLDCPKRANMAMLCWHEKMHGEIRKCNEVEPGKFPAFCPLEDR